MSQSPTTNTTGETGRNDQPAGEEEDGEGEGGDR